MRIDRACAIAAVLVLLAAPWPTLAQNAGAPAPPPKRAEKKKTPPPAPPPAKPAPPPAPPLAPPRPAPSAPKPSTQPEDEAIIENLELFMLMEMLKDYEILQETER